jgi:hypothetical protein
MRPDHAIVRTVSEDDRALMERLAALEAEVKSDADAQRARKELALQKVREHQAEAQAERQALSARQAELVTRKKRPTAEPAPVEDEDDHDDRGSDLGGALALAKKANDVKNELAKKGEKSWIKSGIASMLLGPLGWLYAGSFREAIPASVVYLAFAAILSKLPFVMWPVMMVALPLSGIAGVVYAMQFNKTGSRQRLWGDKKKKKELPPGK